MTNRTPTGPDRAADGRPGSRRDAPLAVVRTASSVPDGPRGRVLPVRSLSERDRAAWEDLARRALEPNPMAEPTYVEPVARHLPWGSEVVVAVAEDRGRWLGCVPLRPVHDWYNIRYPIAANKIRRSTYLGTPLLDVGRPTDAAEALLVAVAGGRRSLGCRLLGLDSLCAGGPVERELLAAADRLGLASYVHEDFERGFLLRRPDGDYLDHLSSKFRGNFRSQRRQLGDVLGCAPRLVDRAGDPAAVDEFIRLEGAGYKADGVALEATPGDPEFFREMCAGFAAHGRLHVLALEAAGITLAMLVWLRAGDGLVLVKGTYDERYRRYGPGTLAQVDSLEFFHDRTDARWIDTCSSPDNAAVLKLYRDRTRITTRLFSLGSRLDATVVAALPGLRRAHRLLVDGGRRTVSLLTARDRTARGPGRDPGRPEPVGSAVTPR